MSDTGVEIEQLLGIENAQDILLSANIPAKLKGKYLCDQNLNIIDIDSIDTCILSAFRSEALIKCKGTAWHAYTKNTIVVKLM